MLALLPVFFLVTVFLLLSDSRAEVSDAGSDSPGLVPSITHSPPVLIPTGQPQRHEPSPRAAPLRRSATPFEPVPPTRTPRPTATRRIYPTATVQASAQIEGMTGYGQLLPLSCEARSAADWARHFGITIHELDFLARLPHSDNPDEGFVGSVYGDWGQIPPGPYGVHAGPVASVLRTYGVAARAARHLRFYDLQAEVSAGRPVIVWVIGHVEPGKGVPYQVEGQTVTVARYEHTVILTGYTPENVSILDGNTTYQRSIDTFLKSWGSLGNMAILWEAPGARKPAGGQQLEP